MKNTSLSLLPFIQVSKENLKSETPHLFLEVKAPSQLSLTLPYRIQFTIRRAEKDCSGRPCIVKWSPVINGFSSTGFVLLHDGNTAGSFEMRAVDQSGLGKKPPEEDSIVVQHGQDHFLWELAPGAEVRFAATLPAHHYAALQAGETYVLLYPGEEVAVWDWGTVEQQLGQVMKPRSPSLAIPGGARISFTAHTEKTEWLRRAVYEAEHGFDMANLAEQRWRQEEARKSMRIEEGAPEPIGPDERVVGAPILSLTMECPPTVTRNERFTVTINFTYNGKVCESVGGSATETATRPITFRSWAVIGLDDGPRKGFRLYRRRCGNVSDSVWEACDLDDGDQGCTIYDAPDVAVRVVEHKDFTTLRPGESWTTSISLQAQIWSCLPHDMVTGDVFLYGFMGAVVDWWDWGTAEDHVDTVVMLPCWAASRVTEPADNGGRPKLVVPFAEPVEFKVVEGVDAGR